MNEDRLREIRERGEHLVAIKSVPSWPAVKDIFQRKIDGELRRMVNTPVVDRQALDYGRGLIRGMQAFIDAIDKGEQTLEEAIRKASLLEQANEGADPV